LINLFKTTELKGNGTLPELRDLMKLRENPETMITFCDNFLSCVVGKVEWKRKVMKNLVQEIATNSDEGFALLVLENIWDEWSKIDAKEYFFAKHKTNQGVKRKQPGGGRWTSHSKGATRFGGWNAEGVKRFNELCAFVAKDREINGGFDVDYLNTMKMQSMETVKTTTTLVAYDELEKAFAEV